MSLLISKMLEHILSNIDAHLICIPAGSTEQMLDAIEPILSGGFG